MAKPIKTIIRTKFTQIHAQNSTKQTKTDTSFGHLVHTQIKISQEQLGLTVKRDVKSRGL